MTHYGGRMQETGRFPGVHLDHPDIGYVSIADGYGIEGERVSAPADLPAALLRAKRAMNEGRPYLVDVKIETIGDFDKNWYDFFSVATGNNVRA
jgi:thiamine pyrophosphate-dependent acetolactate synthase large subunit-like protein